MFKNLLIIKTLYRNLTYINYKYLNDYNNLEINNINKNVF